MRTGLNSIAATANSNYTGCSQEGGFSQTADGNNHLSGFAYDVSGNTTNDGVNSYAWNAESQLTFAAGVNYLYDGDGRRVSKSNGKLYWYDGGGEILAETDASGKTTAEYIFFGGKRVAMIPWSGSPAAPGNPTYYVEDMLGTSRIWGVTTPYERSTGATTSEQRAAVQGKPCVDCGKVQDKMVANHKTPLCRSTIRRGK